MYYKTWQEYFDDNKKLWNAKTPIHVKSAFYNQSKFLEQGNSLNEVELNEVGDVEGKKILHLQCHFGQDSISWQKKGAEVTAIDLSDEAIEVAKKLNVQMNTNVHFICCNVYEINDHLTEQYDIILTSYGTIGWLPDLSIYTKLIHSFLKPGGFYYIVDFHPFIWTLDDEYTQFGYNYFNTGVISEEIDGTYADREATIRLKEHGWNHPTSELLNALLQTGLKLEFFNEFDFSAYNCFPKMEERGTGKWQFEHFKNRIPYMYSLKASKVN